jgi:beta-galactosidase GanA
MTISRLFIPVLLLAAASNSGAQTSPLPQIRRNGAVQQLFVDNKPFLMLAGELHNSSASSVEYMKPIWDRLAAMHLNTVIGTVSWELIEPVEGRFDFSLVDAQIRNARQRNLKLVLIWFATWKNAGSSYVPHWVKADQKRFPPMVLKVRPGGGTGSMLASYMERQGTGPLSPFSEETLRADAAAFRAVMRHIRDVDAAHTVVMMQVENEAGSLGDSRDRSTLAEAAWAKPVPSDLMNYLARNKAALLPEMQEVWGRNGYKSGGMWAEVFGNDEWAC